MKKTYYFLLLFTQIFWAQNAFEQGNQLYQKENYSAAIASYESIINSGQHSAEVYFNLGNCYYKLHKIAPAVYNYEKALQLNPSDVEIQTNLEYARKMAIDDIKVIPKVGFQKLLSDLTSSYHYDTWGWIAVFFGFLFLAFFAGYYFSEKTLLKRIFFIGMFFWIVLLCLSAGAGFYEKNTLESIRPAIVFAESCSVKSEPKNNAQEAFMLHEGTKVFVLESIANWKKIQLTDETTGWIPDTAIKELN